MRCAGAGLDAERIAFFGNQNRSVVVGPPASVEAKCGGMCNEISEHVFSVLRSMDPDNSQSGQSLSGVVETDRFL